jgi:serine/threonine-protein kinase
MKSWRLPALFLPLLLACLFGWLAFSADQLPERVATHFDGSGRPNGWMNRSTHLRFLATLGTGLPLLIVGVCFVLRFLPNRRVNLPNRDYWLAAERRAQTFAFLHRHLLWLACLLVGFVIGLHWAILQANRLPSPRLSTPLLLAMTGGLLAGIGVWMVTLLLRFRRKG